MAKVKYWEDDKPSKKGEPCEENKYSKWKVESALESLQRAQEIIGDSKMLGFVEKCLLAKQQETAAVAEQIGMEEKVRAKSKETFRG